ncbi:MAG: DUF3141 domain-containing protein [Casimicrobiaceae bacterium]
MADLNLTIDRASQISRWVGSTLDRRVRAARERYARQVRDAHTAFHGAEPRPVTPLDWWRDAREYATDAAQRSLLFWDTLRQRGNNYLAHEAAGKPPLLHYPWETVADGRSYARPVNHALVRVIPPPDLPVDDALRPFVVIDPRAGHGPGIGGFKKDSAVGVAMKAGHPVYFVIFFPEPEPGQTVADICDAEAEFVRVVAARHPDSPKPVLVGNCQGGWAVMMLAASRPDIAGPVVINGAPMSYWSGNDGENPMRYAGGLSGGSWVSMLASDLGGGRFDGAHLVSNFENLNPANTYWEKYYHLYANVDREAPRFLEFERWWGGFYLYNDEEIRWIVNNLFVGNKLSVGEAKLGPGRFFDLKAIKSPIIVFASMGDNITPPQQAFNWISDVYSSTDEIKANGQTIVGLLHEDVGHLGIFVSGKVAKKEHAQIVELLKYIQQLPPGLYGMQIRETTVGRDGEIEYEVTLHERNLEDLRKLQKFDRTDEKPFEAVAALSELNERAYELLVRPLVRQLVPEWAGKIGRDLHPLRMQRWMFSDRNPWLAALPGWAAMAASSRQPRRADNSFVKAEKLASAGVVATLDLYRDLRDAAAEAAFFQIYGSMMSLNMADQQRAIRRAAKFDPRGIPAVRQVLDTIEAGSPIEGIMRIGLLITKAGGGKRKLAQMERVRELLAPSHMLDGVTEDELRRLLHEETIVVEFEPDRAKRALPKLLRTRADRRAAHALLDAIETLPLEARQRALVTDLRQMLPLPPASRSRAVRQAPKAARKLAVRATD